MIARAPIADWVRGRYFPGGLTYAGHPLACASAVASIEAFREEGIVENTRPRWARTHQGQRCTSSPGVIRRSGRYGARLLLGLEAVSRETQEMLVPFNAGGEAAAPVARMAKAALERGLYLMTHWNVVMVVPPLTITREEATRRSDPRRGARDRGRVLRGLIEEGRDRRGRLVEGVPEDVGRRDDDDLEEVAERLAMGVEQVVVRKADVSPRTRSVGAGLLERCGARRPGRRRRDDRACE